MIMEKGVKVSFRVSLRDHFYDRLELAHYLISFALSYLELATDSSVNVHAF